jgi:hypothetical protein
VVFFWLRAWSALQVSTIQPSLSWRRRKLCSLRWGLLVPLSLALMSESSSVPPWALGLALGLARLALR